MSLQKLTTKRVAELIRAGVVGEHRDAAARGLILRVRSPKSHSWSIRRHLYGKNHRLDLGDDWTLDEARDLAGEVERRVKAKVDPFWRDPSGWEEHFAAAKLRKHGIDPSALAPEPVDPPPNAGRRMPEGPAMLWVDALESWVDHVGSIRRPDTARSYRRSMRIAEMRAFEDRWVSEIKVEEVAEAVYAIHKRGAERQSRATAIAARLFFKWLGSASQRSKSGVTQYAMKDLESPEFTNRATKKLSTNRSAARIPSGPEIGVVARGLRKDGPTTERDRLAGLLVLYSCQRRRTVAAAERAQFESCGALGGIWKMPPSHRKTAEEKMRRGIAVGDHVVPLPPQAWAVVKRAVALSGDSPYLFPSTRQRRVGQESLHMDPSSITHAWSAIAGNPCSPHDIRRGFGTTYGRQAGLKLEQVKAVLDHNEGVQSGDVTAVHYAFLNGEEPKWPIMTSWCEFVDLWAATRD